MFSLLLLWTYGLITSDFQIFSYILWWEKYSDNAYSVSAVLFHAFITWLFTAGVSFRTPSDNTALTAQLLAELAEEPSSQDFTSLRSPSGVTAPAVPQALFSLGVWLRSKGLLWNRSERHSCLKQSIYVNEFIFNYNWQEVYLSIEQPTGYQIP